MTEEEFSNLTIEELKNNYRFKTEEEFKAEFGENFEHKTIIFFNRGLNCMSLLYGMPLNSFYLRIGDKGRQSMHVKDIRTHYDSDWIVTYDMLTRIDNRTLNKQIIKDKDVSKCLFKIEV